MKSLQRVIVIQDRVIVTEILTATRYQVVPPKELAQGMIGLATNVLSLHEGNRKRYSQARPVTTLLALDPPVAPSSWQAWIIAKTVCR